MLLNQRADALEVEDVAARSNEEGLIDCYAEEADAAVGDTSSRYCRAFGLLFLGFVEPRRVRGIAVDDRFLALFGGFVCFYISKRTNLSKGIGAGGKLVMACA